MTIFDILRISIHLLTGLAVAILILNRVVINWVEGSFKSFVAIGMLVLFPFGWGGYALLAGPSVWGWAPVVVLLAFVVGEIERALKRRWLAGSAPVSSENVGTSLLRPVTTQDLAIYHYEVEAPKMRGDRLRVVHLTDLHIKSNGSLEYTRSVLKKAMAEKPDLIIYTGDFVCDKGDEQQLGELLKSARGRYGTFAVRGNHDHWTRPERIKEELEAAGIEVLPNLCAAIETESGDRVLVCGCEHPWGPALHSKIVESDGADLVLLLTHSIDHVKRLTKLPVDAIFGGHYHAGQLQPPLVGPVIVPSVHGRLYHKGHFVIRKKHLFVSSGVGASSVQLRLYCQPDFFVVDFLSKSN